MAENDQEQERTEDATSRRRDEAREKGQVARSQELVSVGILVACLIYFYFQHQNLIFVFFQTFQVVPFELIAPLPFACGQLI